MSYRTHRLKISKNSFITSVILRRPILATKNLRMHEEILRSQRRLAQDDVHLLRRMAQLSAGGGHIAAARRADRRMNAVLLELVSEIEHFLTGRNFVVEFRDGVIRNEIHFADDAFKGFLQTAGRFFRTGHIFNQNIFRRFQQQNQTSQADGLRI